MSTIRVERYHPALVALHWALAVLIIFDLGIASLVLVHIPNDAPMKIEGLRSHMIGGLLILTFMLIRLAVRTKTAKPAEAPTGSALLDHVAWWSHRLLYVTVFAMVASGLIMGLQAHVPDVVFFGRGQLPPDFWVFPLRGVHYVLSRLLMALIALHICGAFYHVILRRDRLFRRVWFGRRFQETTPASAQRLRAASFWDYAPWLNRAILALPLLLFVLIGFKYLATPDKVATASGMLLRSQAAVTDLRVEGALFFALAALTLASLLDTRRILAGLGLIATVVGFVTAARILGYVVDGPAAETTFKLVPEVVLLTLSSAGILVELGRRRHLARAPHRDLDRDLGATIVHPGAAMTSVLTVRQR
ncbi:MAG: cytochrome b/b6 domain-containing protein [Xanthobacteraceae bacterium]